MTYPMRVSEWLGQMDGHDILGRADAVKDFEAATGQTTEDWPSYSKEVMQRMIDRDTGKAGGYLEGTGPFVPVLDLAETFARRWAKGYMSNKMGRGSKYRDLVTAIKQAGY